MKAVEVRVEGRVQGVGFRYRALVEARRLGVNGWIRNEADGSVRAFLQGPAAAVDALSVWMAKGPPGSLVRSIEVRETSSDPLLHGFETK